MTPRPLIVMLSALVACGAPAPTSTVPPQPAARAPDPEADRAAIVRVFDSYVAKVVSGDRSGAVALIDRETMEFYETLRQNALSLSAAELKQRPIDEQILIITFRTGKRAADMRRQKIEDLVAAAIIPVGKQTGSMRLGPVTVRGDRASGHPWVGDIEVPIAFDFHRVPDSWRLNFVEVTRAAMLKINEGAPEETLRALAVYYKMDLDALYEPLE